MSRFTPLGAARARFLAKAEPASPAVAPLHTDDPELEDLAYLGWEIARCAPALEDADRRALAALAAAVLAAARDGSTRVPVDRRLAAVLGKVGAAELVTEARALLERAAAGDAAVACALGVPGDRTPLELDGPSLYAERMRVLEERFAARALDRVGRSQAHVDPRGVARSLKAVADGPPALTDEQRRAVREALTVPLALVTGGPGTGKTTIVVALLRAALGWSGLRTEHVAIAAPTGKAAQRLSESIRRGFAAAGGGLHDAATAASLPEPQTLHRLLGWSPISGRFARHENDPLPQKVVIVDEASMIDLGAMDRLLRALRPDARLVLLGDADQLPSVEAGAVFRDLCASLGAARLTTNLRVATDPGARRIVAAAAAVNAGTMGEGFAAAVARRHAVDDVSLDAGVEHLDAPWSAIEAPWLARWWTDRVACLPDFASRAARVFHLREGVFDDADAAELRALYDHHARARILCVTRGRHLPTGAEAINDALLVRLSGAARVRRGRSVGLAPGAPVLFERNDYERRLFNGDQAIVVRVDAGDGHGARLAALFPREAGFATFPVDTLSDLVPAFAMTVHKAQGSEVDHVALVLPEADMPLLTRELVYTAITRARRSVRIVGTLDVLARAIGRGVDRFSGVAERLGRRGR